MISIVPGAAERAVPSVRLGCRAAVTAIVAAAAVLRLWTAWTLPIHIDEPNMLLAARMVAERGVPVLPSGVLYLHGTTLSYLSAPLVWLGFGQLDDLQAQRLWSVLAGTLAVWLAWLLGKRVTGSAGWGLAAAVMLALDPLSVLWSGYDRMYALEQALAVGLALVWLALLDAPGARPRLALGAVGLAWLATFTHLSAALLWPAMLATAVAVVGRRLRGSRQDVALALAGSAAAPLALVGLTTVVGGAGTRAAGEADWLPGLSFLGDQNIDLARLLAPSLAGWAEMFEGGMLAGVMPALLAAASGLVAAGLLLRPAAAPSERVGSWLVLAFCWLPVGITALLTGDPEQRYLLLTQPFALLVAVLAARRLWAVGGDAISGAGAAVAARWSAVVAVLLIVTHDLTGLATVHAWGPPVFGDFRGALAHVAAAREPGQPVLVGSAPVAFLGLGGSDLAFFPGNPDSLRTSRYTRSRPDGTATDYWIGMPAIQSAASLCRALGDPDGAWVVVDAGRFERKLVYKGEARSIVLGAADPVFARDGTLVFAARPPGAWEPGARRRCGLPPNADDDNASADQDRPAR